ncbi:MAG TPA: hypothetical protein PKA00_01425 [Saprospiraceae bacterium]|nr:hypothetical protein [Saprospiraceae bacterium]HMQ81529.1 hypothetical protein [Saprospiraceae bacterium]
MEEISKSQKMICESYEADICTPQPNSKVGVSINLSDINVFPINGLRHPQEGETWGWYFWAGEDFSEDPGFFFPLHRWHLKEWRYETMKFLALPLVIGT